MAYAKIRPRRGTAYFFTTINPVLEEGEIAIEYPETGVGTGLSKFKIGDGVTNWSELPYAFDGNAAYCIEGGSVTGKKWNYSPTVESYYPKGYIEEDMWDLTHIDYDNNNMDKAYKYHMDNHVPNYDNSIIKPHNTIAIPIYKGLGYSISYNKNSICCELCKTKYPDYLVHNNIYYNILFYKPNYKEFIPQKQYENILEKECKKFQIIDL